MPKNIILFNDHYYLDGYDSIILDCDGVILNSNFIKEKNINLVLSKYLFGDDLIKCIEYFNNNAGLTRESKLKLFISDEALLNKILNEYNSLNLKSLINAPIVKGLKNLIQIANEGSINVDVLSGGDQVELIEIFTSKNILHFFTSVYGGPISKIDHLQNKNLSQNSIFFGDSAYDFKIAQKFNIDFGLIYGQTDQIFTNNSNLIKIIAPNFKNIKIKKHD